MKCAMVPTRMYQIQSRRAEKDESAGEDGVGWEQDGSAHVRVLQQGARGVAEHDGRREQQETGRKGGDDPCVGLGSIAWPWFAHEGTAGSRGARSRRCPDQLRNEYDRTPLYRLPAFVTNAVSAGSATIAARPSSDLAGPLPRPMMPFLRRLYIRENA
jgi:hypothetical protein